MILYSDRKLNYPHAFYKIATFYQYGKSVEKTKRKHSSGLKRREVRAKNEGRICVLNNRWILLRNGIGVKKNYSKALKYYSLAERGRLASRCSLNSFI